MKFSQYLRPHSAHKADMKRIREAINWVTIKNNFLTEILLKQLPKVIPQVSDFIVTEIPLCNLTGFPESHDEKNIFGPGPPARFMASTMDKRFNWCSLTNI